MRRPVRSRSRDGRLLDRLVSSGQLQHGVGRLRPELIERMRDLAPDEHELRRVRCTVRSPERLGLVQHRIVQLLELPQRLLDL